MLTAAPGMFSLSSTHRSSFSRVVFGSFCCSCTHTIAFPAPFHTLLWLLVLWWVLNEQPQKLIFLLLLLLLLLLLEQVRHLPRAVDSLLSLILQLRQQACRCPWKGIRPLVFGHLKGWLGQGCWGNGYSLLGRRWQLRQQGALMLGRPCSLEPVSCMHVYHTKTPSIRAVNGLGWRRLVREWRFRGGCSATLDFCGRYQVESLALQGASFMTGQGRAGDGRVCIGLLLMLLLLLLPLLWLL
mmetsp:Transcript_12364/g.32641  ORF Transcript_12364/g.32641 Transcript_12364/m.32641 type:complete len:241 (-) Transcript_12364:167-889(-)